MSLDAHTPPLADLEALEHELCRIPEIRAVRVVVDTDGTPAEVHVVATPDKHAKQLVRDVQTVALARFGVDLDRRTISVVQLAPTTPLFAVAEEAAREQVPAPAPPPVRVHLRSVGTESDGRTVTTRVRLGTDDAEAVGEASGAAASTIVPRLVADATLAALRSIDPAAATAALESAAVSTVGDRDVVCVVVVMATHGVEEPVAGAAVVRGAGVADATARAVLDATNRRHARL